MTGPLRNALGTQGFGASLVFHGKCFVDHFKWTLTGNVTFGHFVSANLCTFEHIFKMIHFIPHFCVCLPYRFQSSVEAGRCCFSGACELFTGSRGHSRSHGSRAQFCSTCTHFIYTCTQLSITSCTSVVSVCVFWCYHFMHFQVSEFPVPSLFS